MENTGDEVVEQARQAETPDLKSNGSEGKDSTRVLPSQGNAVEGANGSLDSSSVQAAAQQGPDNLPSGTVGDKTTSPTSPSRPDCGTLDLRINDWHGHPITDLEFKVIQGKTIAFQGKTDATGMIPTITGLKIGHTFEIHVKKESGQYKFAALGKIYGEESYACLQSPKTRFEFSTEPHHGMPGNAEQKKEKTIQSHNQIPAAKPEITGNPERKPTIELGRNKNGNPTALIADGLRNWYNKNTNNSGAPKGGVTDIERVQRLIDFAYRQAEWKYQDGITTDAYIKKMHDKTFVEPEKKARNHSEAMCNKYVKIALWYAYHEGEDIKPVGSGISPAREMGPALLKAGYIDITTQLPDARWAAPGDIIVYQKKLKPNASGHIDIRTYDGYISDFVTQRLPANKFKITGIYRKYFDPLPERRMKAFLKTIREWECHEESDDSKRYYLLQQPINSSRRFADTSSHPFNVIGGDKTFSGAYQITLGTWKDGHNRGDTPLDFSPLTQDRIAIWKSEDRGALGFIRNGEIKKAIDALLAEWSSLPGGVDVRKGKPGDKNYRWTVADFLNAYEENLEQLKG